MDLDDGHWRNLDHYIETTCNAGAGPGSGYVFNGTCTPFEVRVESIGVRGASPVSLTVLRSIHGPVVGTAGTNVITQKRAHWQRELESVHGFFGFDRARNIQHFEAAVKLIPTSHNFIYADKTGNIAYWQAGHVPVRPAGFDARLPFPGNGSAEWPGDFDPLCALLSKADVAVIEVPIDRAPSVECLEAILLRTNLRVAVQINLDLSPNEAIIGDELAKTNMNKPFWKRNVYVLRPSGSP